MSDRYSVTYGVALAANQFFEHPSRKFVLRVPAGYHISLLFPLTAHAVSIPWVIHKQGNNPKGGRFRDTCLPGLFMLAIAATVTAIFMSILAGWQRGGWLSERSVWCAISVVLVLCAHLMPALCREA